MIVGYSRLKFKRKKIRYCIFWLLTQCDIAGKLIYIYNKNAVYKMLNQSSPIFKASVHLYFCCMGFLEASDFFWRRLSLEDAPMSILMVYWEHKAFTSLYCLLSEVLTFEMLNEVGLRDSLCFTLGFFFFFLLICNNFAVKFSTEYGFLKLVVVCGTTTNYWFIHLLMDMRLFSVLDY